ncbi:MAG TPA: DnaT-like ssDNA-binding protein [Bacteroidales bacterium]|nr:DnaT-like ssDNA-binding protein [Bacteroidales bacterium]
MSVTLVSTIGGSTSNTYVTLAQVDTYMEGVPWFDSIWDDLTDAIKNSRILQAARAIDRLNFQGAKYLDDQAMEFPRDITDQSTDIGGMPQKVKDAQCELIIWQYQHMDSSTGEADKELSEIGLGKSEISLKFAQNKSPENNLAGGMPESVRALLRTWLLSLCNVELLRA